MIFISQCVLAAFSLVVALSLSGPVSDNGPAEHLLLARNVIVYAPGDKVYGDRVATSSRQMASVMEGRGIASKLGVVL